MRYDENFREIIIKELKKGSTNSVIYPIAIAHGYSGTYKSFRDYTLQLKKKLDICTENENSNNLYGEGNDDLFINILKSRSSIKILELCDIFKCPPSYIQLMINNYRNKGYEVTTDGYRVYLSKNFVKEPEVIKQIGTTEVSFAIASDLHFGSKACQITALKSFCDICKKRDVHHILVPGDITAGHNVYPGQVYEEYAITADEQMNSVLANLPDGFEWYFMGGNHDHSFISKAGGFNIVADLSMRRDDIKYVGFDIADIPIMNNIDARLFHPSGGQPYSFSYKLQKSSEQLAYEELVKITYGSKEKPSIRFLLSGHLHVQVQCMLGPIFAAQCGCFEGKTNYIKKKGLTPSIGGYIIKASLGSSGMIHNFEAKFYLFDEIEDDWKNYSHSYGIEKTLTPIFIN